MSPSRKSLHEPLYVSDGQTIRCDPYHHMSLKRERHGEACRGEKMKRRLTLPASALLAKDDSGCGREEEDVSVRSTSSNRQLEDFKRFDEEMHRKRREEREQVEEQRRIEEVLEAMQREEKEAERRRKEEPALSLLTTRKSEDGGMKREEVAKDGSLGRRREEAMAISRKIENGLRKWEEEGVRSRREDGQWRRKDGTIVNAKESEGLRKREEECLRRGEDVGRRRKEAVVRREQAVLSMDSGPLDQPVPAPRRRDEVSPRQSLVPVEAALPTASPRGAVPQPLSPEASSRSGASPRHAPPCPSSPRGVALVPPGSPLKEACHPHEESFAPVSPRIGSLSPALRPPPGRAEVLRSSPRGEPLCSPALSCPVPRPHSSTAGQPVLLNSFKLLFL